MDITNEIDEKVRDYYFSNVEITEEDDDFDEIAE